MKSLIAVLVVLVGVDSGFAMGSIQRILTNRPPVVVPSPTNPVPPAVTNTIPPSTQTPGVYALTRLWSGGDKEWKCSGVCIDTDGAVVMGIYGNDLPRNRTYLMKDGKKVWPASGYYDAETLFPYPGGFVVAERGYQLVRDGNGYKSTKCKSRWAACMSLSPKPVIYNAAPNSKIKALDFYTGATLQELPGTDVPHDAATLAGGVVGVAVEGYGIVYTDKRKDVRCKPRSYIVADGRELVGDGGRVRQIVGDQLVAYLDGDPQLGEVVDSMAQDGAGVWLTTSAPDALYLIPTGSHQAQLIDRKFPDTAQGGSVFGCSVAVGGGRRVFVRNNGQAGNKWEAYEVTTGTTPAPTSTPIKVTGFDPETAKWLVRSSKGYRVTSSVKVYWARQGTTPGIRMDIAPGMKGTNCYAGVFIQRPDAVYAGAWDGIGDSTGNKFKKATNLGHQNEKGGPYIAGTDSALRRKLMPQPEEVIGINCFCVDTKEQTTISPLSWTPLK